MTRFRIAFASASTLWAGMTVAAPFAATAAASGRFAGMRPLALFAYAIGALVCHQRPERSFHLSGVQLPVCARCTGIYAGAAAMSLWLLATALRQRSHFQAPLPTRTRVWSILLLASLPTAATLVFEWAMGEMPGHWTRAASGAFLGAVVGWIVWRALDPQPRLKW